jgi:predicted Zn-dependent protease with MMP-like domain/predicted Zn-dependent protease
MQAAWEALESGDVAGARAMALTLADDESAAAEILMLEAACDREDGDVESALARLERAAKSDPEWCTPELWMAEVLGEIPERQAEGLRHAERAIDLADDEEEFLAALACKATIEIELGRPADARKTLANLPSAELPLDDPAEALEFVHLLIEAENPDEARARLEVLTATQPTLADPWYLRGVLADMEGDEKTRTAAWVKTRELDLQELDAVEHAHAHHGDCAHLSEADVVAIAEETLASIPDAIRGRMRDVPVIVVDLPAAADVKTGADPRALGLFHGATDAERGVEPALTEIVLFRKNIERVAHDSETLKEEVRATLLHEAGHFFGLDERALAELGLQ